MEYEMEPSRKEYLDELFRAFEIVAEGAYVYLCDLAYDYSRWSAEAITYFGLPGEYMVGCGKIWEAHILPEDRENYSQSIDAIFSGQVGWHDMQYRARNRDGQYVVCTCRGTVIRGSDGQPLYFAGSIRNNGLVNSVDSLTGLQNQYGLFQHLDALYSKQARANIMMIGIKRFSTINEMWGYDFGNIVIHKLVQELKQIFCNEGVLYRADGVRFVLLTRSLTMEQLAGRYETVRQHICERLEIDGYHPNLQVCGSALEIDTFDVNPQAMFSCLGYAYNLSRERGNGALQIFRNEIDETRTNLMTLINTIRRSIEHDCQGFLLYYQPIMDANTHTLSGCEALLRWRSPEYGLVPPNRFIPIIENDPAFVKLGEWILRRAMEDTKPFLTSCPAFELNVNIAYEQLKQHSFVEMVKRNLTAAAYPPENLCLEITERCRLLDISRLGTIISELRDLGVRFAIDDFGTGYSSMDILNQLKFDVVKIDKVFVDNIAKGGKAVRLIGVMNELAEICGSQVCAEGVESQEQCEIVRQCGVDTIQGYYFSKPVPVDTFQRQFVPAD
ncbi:MAG: EAL domain-containing protein [Oscillospiraceae bacterium]|nr:EAL domain-containing protein [Oscillospiraceae bacterium]